MRVVILGSLGLAVEFLEWLLSRQGVDMVGAVCSRQPMKPWRTLTGDRDMQSVAPGLGVRLLQLDDLATVRPDLGVAVRFHQLLRKEHLSAFGRGCLNLHGAILPEMQGSMCDSMAIIEGRPEFGASVHWIDEGVDSGPVLAQRRFELEETHTVFDLFSRSNQIGLELLKTVVPDVIQGTDTSEPQGVLASRLGVETRVYRAGEVMPYKRITPDLNPDALVRRVRAFDFPGQEPAFLEVGGRRVYCRTSA